MMRYLLRHDCAHCKIAFRMSRTRLASNRRPALPGSGANLLEGGGTRLPFPQSVQEAVRGVLGNAVWLAVGYRPGFAVKFAVTTS